MAKGHAPVEFKIHGDLWTLIHDGRLKKNWGLCLHDEQTIKVHPDHKNQKAALNTYVHEVLHSVLPHHHEPTILQAANVLTNVLWKLGYRKVTE